MSVGCLFAFLFLFLFIEKLKFSGKVIVTVNSQ